MGTKETVKFDLKDYYDAENPFYYFTGQGNKQAIVRIRRIGVSDLIVDTHVEIKMRETTQGFIIIKNNQGILNFTARFVPEKLVDNKLDVLKLQIDPKSIKSVNRREYYRIKINPPIECRLIDEAGLQGSVFLNDLSAGGVGFGSPVPLKCNKVYQISVPLDIAKTNPLKLPILVLHDITNRFPKGEITFFYGASFVAGQTAKGFEPFTEDTRAGIIRYVNQYLIELRRKLKDL
ncbi:MAG: PilZ domain-containing protein [Deltaproteobacteria bacterium]|nr:PilZ domain-containing protein [Deltaproteobacteria bacterium]